MLHLIFGNNKELRDTVESMCTGYDLWEHDNCVVDFGELELDVGRIAFGGNDFVRERIDYMYSCGLRFQPDLDDGILFCSKSRKAVERVLSGEQTALWVSDDADSYCGLASFACELDRQGFNLFNCKTVCIIRLEGFAGVPDGARRSFGQWESFSRDELRCLMSDWTGLRRENALLRILRGGRLESVSDAELERCIMKLAGRICGSFYAGALVDALLQGELSCARDAAIYLKLSELEKRGVFHMLDGSRSWFIPLSRRNILVKAK